MSLSTCDPIRVVGAVQPGLADTAAQVAGEAAALVREARTALSKGEPVAVETKSSETDVVTAVDHASERLIRQRLAQLRPGEAVVGEEEGGAASGDGVTWVVDPIDGTVNFLYGFPWFAVSVAAQVGGESVAGAVIEPISGRRWVATRGHGATVDGRPLRIDDKPSAVTGARLDVSLVATGFAYVADRRARQATMVSRLLEYVRDIRRAGAGSLDLCSVAAGWVDGYVEHGLHRWDWAAGALIAAEAGALVSVPGQDQELGHDATFAATPSIVAALRDALLECGAGEV